MESLFKFTKQNLLKADVIITCLLLLALGGYYAFRVKRTNDSSKASLLNLENSTKDQRLISYQISLFFNGTTFPIVSCKEILNDNPATTSFAEKSVVILLSRSGCSPCQVRELKNLEKLRERIQDKAKFVSIYLADEVTGNLLAKREQRLLQKVSQISFQIWYSEDAVLASYLFYKKFPLIFIVDRQKVVSSFIPIPEDEEFSEAYMNAFAHVLNQ